MTGSSAEPTQLRDPIRDAHELWLGAGWGSAADGMAMVTSIVRVNQIVMERVDAALRPYNLSFARYEVLRLLAFTSTGRMPMARLGSLLQVHPTSVTSAVAKLEGQELVERLRRTSDRRVVLAAITESGRDLVERATVRLNEDVFERLGLEAADVVLVTDLLTRFRGEAGDPVGQC